MLTKRFFISWIASSIVMFLLSYVWHGIFLTDFSRLSYPKEIFLIIACLVYLIIGFVVAKAIDVKFLEKYFKRKPIIKGAIAGAAIGFALFLISTVVGVSFSTGSKLENLLLDVSWQVIEQALGGAVVGIAHIFVFDSSAIIED
jgi:H+/Cl- antiporter ClcA